jgi:hypothetical protein
MIFKVHYNSALLNSGKPNTYVSFCERKLHYSRLEMHNFLYKFLYDRKIINFPENMFSFEVNGGYSVYSCRTVKCYVSTERKKWYCKLEQLMPVAKSTVNYVASDVNILRQQIMESMSEVARRDLQQVIDAEIFQEINNAARGHQDYLVNNNENNYAYVNPLRRNLDYVAYAQRVLDINYVVNPAANLDAALDQPIQVDPIDE